MCSTAKVVVPADAQLTVLAFGQPPLHAVLVAIGFLSVTFTLQRPVDVLCGESKAGQHSLVLGEGSQQTVSDSQGPPTYYLNFRKMLIGPGNKPVTELFK